MTAADILRDLSERLDDADKQLTGLARVASDEDDVLRALRIKGKAEGMRLAKEWVDEALRGVTS